MWAFAFSPDGTSVAMGGALGRPSVWRTDSWQRQWQATTGHNGYDLSLGFSPDGRTLASSGTDSLTFLYDTASGSLIGNAVGDADNVDTFAHYLPEHHAVVALDHTGALSRRDTDPREWARRACEIAGRDLTEEEWRRHLPGRPYAPTCP